MTVGWAGRLQIGNFFFFPFLFFFWFWLIDFLSFPISISLLSLPKGLIRDRAILTV